jgi:4-hydroxy-tetrahydrodipicolinate synthase
LILCIGGNDTTSVILQLEKLDLNDFTAILSVSPYYNRPTQEGIYQHFKAIATNINANIIIYNVPSRTGSNVLPNTVLRLANDFKNIIGIKESSGNLLQAYEIIKLKPNRFNVISGDDALALPIIMGGGEGVISVIAQGLPSKNSRMINFAQKGNVKDAFVLFYQTIDMINLIYKEGNPSGIKALLKSIGICESCVRLPLLEVSNSLQNKIILEYKKINCLDHTNLY